MYFTENLLIEAVYRHAKGSDFGRSKENESSKAGVSAGAYKRKADCNPDTQRTISHFFLFSQSWKKEKPDDYNGVYQSGTAGNCKSHQYPIGILETSAQDRIMCWRKKQFCGRRRHL